MIKNAKSLKDKARNISKENDVSIQQVLQNYMFERVLERLSKSKYKDNFIIKGGVLLSSMMGINLRTTMDIDTNVTGINFEEDELIQIVTEILSINTNDNTSFEIDNIEKIKQEEDYGGFKFKITGKYENIKVKFHMDVSTGDIITPKAIEYKYKKLFDDTYIDILSYNEETIIAEKIQAILERKINNSRMKDYYDLYFFVKYRWNAINKKVLSEAIVKTFTARNSINELRDIDKTIVLIKNNQFLNKLWIDYALKHSYANDVTFFNTVEAINIIKNEIFANKKIQEAII